MFLWNTAEYTGVGPRMGQYSGRSEDLEGVQLTEISTPRIGMRMNRSASFLNSDPDVTQNIESSSLY